MKYFLRESRVTAIIFLVVFTIGIGLWFAADPVSQWWKARSNVRYSGEWPISASDFAAAKRLVEKDLGWREIITRVTVAGPEEIHFESDEIGPWAGHGHRFIVRKVGGGWMIGAVWTKLISMSMGG